jgi:hypothetical protein
MYFVQNEEENNHQTFYTENNQISQSLFRTKNTVALPEEDSLVISEHEHGSQLLMEDTVAARGGCGASDWGS